MSMTVLRFSPDSSPVSRAVRRPFVFRVACGSCDFVGRTVGLIHPLIAPDPVIGQTAPSIRLGQTTRPAGGPRAPPTESSSLRRSRGREG
jgi:hypothetical protein